MEINGEDLLALLNRLLEMLHQADNNNHQGGIVLNIYEKGSQHVDHVDNQYFYGSLTPDLSPKGEGKETILPEALASEEAMALWQKAQEAGYVDEHYQPKISRTQAALLADEMAKRLGIKEKWKTFEALWNRRNMYRDLQDALNQQQSLQFRDNLKDLFG